MPLTMWGCDSISTPFLHSCLSGSFFFFFQAEDGIRDLTVTGVQTCALPISVAAVVVGGRLLLRPLLRWIARSRTPEIFTATSLLLVVGIAMLMVQVGLSMALGAFLAGVLLADSE